MIQMLLLRECHICWDDMKCLLLSKNCDMQRFGVKCNIHAEKHIYKFFVFWILKIWFIFHFVEYEAINLIQVTVMFLYENVFGQVKKRCHFQIWFRKSGDTNNFEMSFCHELAIYLHFLSSDINHDIIWVYKVFLIKN